MRRSFASALHLILPLEPDLVAPGIAWGDEGASDDPSCEIPFRVSKDGKTLTFGRDAARALRRRAAKRAS